MLGRVAYRVNERNSMKLIPTATLFAAVLVSRPRFRSIHDALQPGLVFRRGHRPGPPGGFRPGPRRTGRHGRQHRDHLHDPHRLAVPPVPSPSRSATTTSASTPSTAPSATSTTARRKPSRSAARWSGILPMSNFDLYGRIGYARTELKVNASATLHPTPLNEKDTPERDHLWRRRPLEFRAPLGPLRRVVQERQDQGRQLRGRRRLPVLKSLPHPEAFLPLATGCLGGHPGPPSRMPVISPLAFSVRP